MTQAADELVWHGKYLKPESGRYVWVAFVRRETLLRYVGKSLYGWLPPWDCDDEGVADLYAWAYVIVPETPLPESLS